MRVSVMSDAGGALPIVLTAAVGSSGGAVRLVVTFATFVALITAIAVLQRRLSQREYAVRLLPSIRHPRRHVGRHSPGARWLMVSGTFAALPALWLVARRGRPARVAFSTQRASAGSEVIPLDCSRQRGCLTRSERGLPRYLVKLRGTRQPSRRSGRAGPLK
jgi:hypothetical protein